MTAAQVRAAMTSVVAALGLACGPPARAPGKPAAAARGGFRQVAPLGFAAEAKAIDQALILGTDARGGATAVPLVGGRSDVELDLLVVRTVPTAVGAMSPVALGTTPAADGTVRIGIFEDTVGGLGPSWRTGVWMAAFVATSVLGKDLTDFTFTAEAKGHVDGASGSGLMAAGYLAAILGVPIDPATTMTGIINPDGTIGPVGGIPQKLDAAIAAGKRRIGYPIGMGQATDLATGELVDVEARARAAGATAIEVADVYGALELLTGTKLPRPLPVAAADLALDPAVVRALDERYAAWHARLGEEWTGVLELQSSGRLPGPLASLVDRAAQLTAQADRLHRAGQPAAAHDRVIAAWTAAASATAIAAVLERARAGDLAGARAKLDDLALGAVTVDERLRAIGAIVPDTMGGHLLMMSAFQQAVGGWGFRTFTEDQLAAAKAALTELEGAPPPMRALPATTDALAAVVAPAVVGVARAVAASASADDALTIERETSINYLCSLPSVHRLASSFRAAASANLAYFESLFVAELAQSLEVPLPTAKVRVATVLPDYLVAIMTADVANMPGLPEELKLAWGERSIAWGLFGLAASEASFFRTSLLVSRFYSLGIEMDANGRTTGVGQPRAFANMLTWAERRAREQAQAARVATGSIPIQTRLHFQIATALVAGDLDDQLAALEHYWAASLFAQTAVMLARNGA